MKPNACKIIGAFLLTVTALISCHSNEEPVEYISEDKHEVPQISITSISSETTTQEPERPKGSLITDYDIREIGDFYNGIARFTLNTSYTGAGIMYPNNEYIKGKYGYVNTRGEVIYAPGFQTAPDRFETPAFVKFQSEQGNRVAYLTETGFLTLEWPDNVIAYGSCSNNLFWIQTVDEQLSGNVYTMTYYHENGRKAFSFSNATPAGYWSDNKYTFYNNFSDFDDNGYAFIDVGTDSNHDYRLVNRDGHLVELKLKTSINELQKAVYEDYTYATIASIDSFCVTGLSERNIVSCKINYTYYDTSYRKYRSHETYMKFAVDYNTLTLYLLQNGVERLTEFSSVEDYILAKYDDQLYILDQHAQNILRSNDDYPDLHGGKVVRYCVSPNGFVTVALASESYALFYSIVSVSGEIVLKPTNKIYMHVANPSEKPLQELHESAIYSSGLLPAQDVATKKWGYLNEVGEWAIQPQFDSARSFSDGLACVNENAFIDTTGKTVFIFNQ